MSTNSYQVIARRWRPKQFAELVGQDHIVRTLTNAIEGGRIAHAYLFVGPRGTGKTSTARLFAKALNAEGGPNIAPDNSSETSQAIMNGSCLDVIEIDGASNNGVDQVRSLRDECQFAPAQCTYKIYIIDEVHMLSKAAFNALLKTLEEPPSHVKFFFATTEAQKVLPTIVSRCQRFEFRPLTEATITSKLSEICESEGVTVEPAALASIARLANGGMRDAQSILDQVISFCGTELTDEDVLQVYGLVSRDRVEALAVAIAAFDFGQIIESVDRFVAEGIDLYRLLVDLQSVIREVLLDAIKHGGKSSKLGVSLTSEQLMRLLDTLHQGEEGVQKGLSDRVEFEVVLLKAAEQSRSRAIDSLIKQVVAAGAAPDEKKKELRIPEVSQILDVVAASKGRSAVDDTGTDESESTTSDSTKVETAVDDHPDALLEASVDFEVVLDSAQTESDTELEVVAPSITLDVARNALRPEILQTLDRLFNGSLTEVRSLDERDQLF